MSKKSNVVLEEVDKVKGHIKINQYVATEVKVTGGSELVTG